MLPAPGSLAVATSPLHLPHPMILMIVATVKAPLAGVASRRLHCTLAQQVRATRRSNIAPSTGPRAHSAHGQGEPNLGRTPDPWRARQARLRVSERTVSRYLATLNRPAPSERQGQSWRTFLENHRESIAAMDFLAVPTASFRT